MLKYAIAGGSAFLGAKLVFDVSTGKALLLAAIAAGSLWASLTLTEGIA